MATYFLVNLIFLIGVMVAFRIKVRRPTKGWWLTLASLIILTALGDSLIVGFGMVAYEPTKLLGITVGPEPIEDFFYALLAAILIPTLWKGFSK